MAIGFDDHSMSRRMRNDNGKRHRSEQTSYDAIAWLVDVAVANDLGVLKEGDSKDNGDIALRRAILADALKCVCQPARTNNRRAQRLAKEAEHWFFSQDARWPFSFVNICAALHFEPDYIRRKLRLWQQQAVPTPPRGCRHVAQRQRYGELAV